MYNPVDIKVFVLKVAIIEFELRQPRRIWTYTTGYFHGMTKQKPLKNIVGWIILLLTAKILRDAMYLTSPNLGQITYKI